jgi:chromosome segregation ATPase
MDLNQAARLIEWLDEERRRDKATIATLQERLAQQQENLETLSRRVGSMESDQTTIRTQLAPNGRDNELLDQMRKEVQQMIEMVETKRLGAERELERRNELARDAITRPVRELTDKINRLERQTTELPAITTEKDRLAGTVAVLQQRVEDVFKRLEDPDRRLAFLEEQRRTDAKRIGDIDSELPELRKALENTKPKLALLEDLSLRNERKIQDVQNGERDRREQMQQFIDQQILLMQQRDQQVEDLIKQFTQHDVTMQENTERFEMWAEAYREMKKIIDDFQRIGERLERRINEVAEMQRLSEDRFRQEWNDWRSDDQKRWKQFNLSNDDVWRSHDKEFDRFVKQFAELQNSIAPLQDAITRLWNLERERAEMYRDRYQQLILDYDTGSSLPLSSPNPSNSSSNGGANER